MLGLQGNASSPKVYRCVACSATFTGLASLLVHQATHASTLSKVSSSPQTQPHHQTQSATTESTNELPSPLAVLPESPPPSFYICDCGEEFLDFGLMLEHKRSHLSQTQPLQPLNDDITLPSETGCDKLFPSQPASLTLETQTDLVLSCPSTSSSPVAEVHTLNAQKEDVALEDGVAMETTPQGQCTPPQDISEEQLEDISATADQMPNSVEEVDLEEEDSGLLGVKRENLPSNNTLMKLLASAYMSRLPQIPPEKQSDDKAVSKQESFPVDVKPASKTEVPQINDLSINQLRRLLTKPGVQTKAPSISRILESSRKRVVSLTKTFSPVVVLETRQKLMDSVNKGTFGRYQCGRCRRVFQNLDRLTEHHFLHKKERIKCCRRCKQLIIGRLPLPDNHICPQLANKTQQPSGSLKHKFSFAPKIVPFHSVGHAKKVFFCPLCKHSYARRWNLKTHRCHGQMSLSSRQVSPSAQRMFTLSSNSNAEIVLDEDEKGCKNSNTIAVGTEVTGRVKVEMVSLDSEQSAVSQLAWTPPAKTFPPFSVKSSAVEQHQDSSLHSLQDGEENSWDGGELGDEDSDEGQWTMPLDDEMQSFNTDDKAVDNREGKQHGLAGIAAPGLRYFVRDGVKRYPCNKCQKTYSRASTLRRHLRLCGFRSPAFGGVVQSGGPGKITLNASNAKPMFPCYVCGKTFNRKDNMMVHRKRCQLQRTVADVERVTVQKSLPGNAAAADTQTQEDAAANWGIMSLPSVLPRRVTCECGVGFTSPRLLVEHLQKHAQESYTCPTCGETVNSWAEYEAHLQIHMHPHNQLLKGLQPQRSQPLLLRFQQQQQSVKMMLQPPQKQPEPRTGPAKKRIVCTRCGNTFATQCSLRRHVAWNRCKGARAASVVTNPPKSFHCSHCNSDFPNSISLIFHQRSGACKPAIKPVRCPVCLRWFGTVDSLQKHLLSHKQSESYRCDVCQGTYPSLKSLKNHRRRIHRIMAGNLQTKMQEPLTS